VNKNETTLYTGREEQMRNIKCVYACIYLRKKKIRTECFLPLDYLRFAGCKAIILAKTEREKTHSDRKETNRRTLKTRRWGKTLPSCY